MRDRRKWLEPGSVLRLGGQDYHLEALEGFGGSSGVYRAWYGDDLNCGHSHHVLIKELYPYHPKGYIYRNDDGTIGWKQEGAEWMERCRCSFFGGNQANLELLAAEPEKVSGNVNSYEAFGTYYSVLPVHGGKSLESILNESSTGPTLRQSAVWTMMLLEALQCFHDHRMLHLDISPDNILMLRKQALLIDYNSVWQMDRPDQELVFSEKEGFTAPEIRLRNLAQIGPASDLYSAAAVFFRLITGRNLAFEDMIGNGLKRCFPKTLPVFCDVPVSAVKKAVQIIGKGLQLTAKRRYQSAEEMYREFEELLLRIDGKGISHSTIYESSRRSFQRQRLPEEKYLERRLLTGDGDVITQEECTAQLEKGSLILLKGTGGMGKTRLLMELWGKAVGSYQPRKSAAVYVPLAEYQEQPGDGTFIRKYILRHLCLWEQTEHLDDAVHELERAVNIQGGFSMILLLDGLNEAGSRQHELIKEIELLGRKKNIGILLTDRTDHVLEYGFSDFKKAELLPLRESELRYVLEEKGFAVPNDQRMLELLKNPMMLSLYCQTAKLSSEAGLRTVPDDVMTVEQLVGGYLDSLSLHEQRVDSGNSDEQLRHQYLLHHFLPEIAGELKSKNKSQLTGPEVYRLAVKSRGELYDRCFVRAFPELLGKSRAIMKDLRDEKEWFDYAVSEQLMDRLDLIRKSEHGYYRLVHDNFLDYLAEANRKNRQQIMRYRRREWMIRGGAVLVGAVFLTAAAVTAERKGIFDRNHLKLQLNEDQQYVLDNVMTALTVNLGVLSQQISVQREILEEAGYENIQNGSDMSALEEFHERVSRKLKSLQTSRALRGAWDLEAELEKAGIEYPVDSLKRLYRATYDMDQVMDSALETLCRKMMDTGNTSFDADRKRAMTEAYKHYLDAYQNMISRHLICIMSAMNDEDVNKLLISLSGMECFQGEHLPKLQDGMTVKAAAALTDQAERDLRSAANDFARYDPELKDLNIYLYDN